MSPYPFDAESQVYTPPPLELTWHKWLRQITHFWSKQTPLSQYTATVYPPGSPPKSRHNESVIHPKAKCPSHATLMRDKSIPITLGRSHKNDVCELRLTYSFFVSSRHYKINLPFSSLRLSFSSPILCPGVLPPAV